MLFQPSKQVQTDLEKIRNYYREWWVSFCENAYAGDVIPAATITGPRIAEEIACSIPNTSPFKVEFPLHPIWVFLAGNSPKSFKVENMRQIESEIIKKYFDCGNNITFIAYEYATCLMFPNMGAYSGDYLKTPFIDVSGYLNISQMMWDQIIEDYSITPLEN